MKTRAAVLVLFGLIAGLANPVHASGDPWASQEVLQPQQLAKILKSTPKDQQPILLHVGFQFLYKNGHIPGSLYVGPANKESGLNHLRTELDKVPRTREIVIYCGCCPLSKCPNVRPAFKAIQAMGFKTIRILSLPDNFEKNWMKKGYPTEAEARTR